jgi:hypothetical protein
MTDTRIKNRHNLIERLRGSKTESLDLDFSYHLKALFWPSPMPKYMDSVDVTVQPDRTTNHHNPTEQLLRLLAPRRKAPWDFTLLPWLLGRLLRRYESRR